MKVLLIGSGGREHSLAYRLALSEQCSELFCAPGNAGTEELAENVNIAVDDIDGLVSFAVESQIDLVVVGPELPLTLGIVDALEEKNILVFGPNKAASILEGSKVFTKNLCQKYNIPTAAFGEFSNPEEAKSFASKMDLPIVVKADGLAAGKGVIICETHDEAHQAIDQMMTDKAFGEAGSKIVVEEFLQGEEVSFFALSDGETVVPLISAQDHKRAYDGEEGPNTGGVGCYSPPHMMTKELHDRIFEEIIVPTFEAMKKEGRPFKGVFYAGLMVHEGQPKLIEYNVRFGDPECQLIMIRLSSDLLEILHACAEGRLAEIKEKIGWFYNTAICIVMSAKGYPGQYEKGSVIKNVDQAEQQEATKVFHAGTKRNDKGELVSNGGRVLNIVATGDDISMARDRAYKAVSMVDWPEGYYRKDIAWRALDAIKNKKGNAA